MQPTDKNKKSVKRRGDRVGYSLALADLHAERRLRSKLHRLPVGQWAPSLLSPEAIEKVLADEGLAERFSVEFRPYPDDEDGEVSTTVFYKLTFRRGSIS